MKRDAPFITPPAPSREDHIIFSGVGFTHFGDECFIITDGVSSLPHAKEAQELTAETALWAYRVVRQRPFYWKEKLEFLKRIFRTSNLTLWQKRRDKGFEEGLAAVLSVLLVGPNYFWAGTAGNCNAFLYREGLIDVLTARDIDEDGMLTKAVGFGRKQLIPSMRSEQLLPGDMLVLATDGIINSMSEDELRDILDGSGDTTETLEKATDRLVQKAKDNGSHGHLAVCLVKRVVV